MNTWSLNQIGCKLKIRNEVESTPSGTLTGIQQVVLLLHNNKKNKVSSLK
jgi:hypothetical protein